MPTLLQWFSVGENTQSFPISLCNAELLPCRRLTSEVLRQCIADFIQVYKLISWVVYRSAVAGKQGIHKQAFL
jgi:hypothetical protein